MGASEGLNLRRHPVDDAIPSVVSSCSIRIQTELSARFSTHSNMDSRLG